MTEHTYIQAVRTLYLQLPNTHPRFSRSDRRLALSLYQSGFSLDLVRSALFLATARRLARNPLAPPLPPVRSLHYFLPVLEEVKLQPLPPGYLQYLESKVRAASRHSRLQVSNNPKTGA